MSLTKRFVATRAPASLPLPRQTLFDPAPLTWSTLPSGGQRRREDGHTGNGAKSKVKEDQSVAAE